MRPLGYIGRTPSGDLYRCVYTERIAVEKHMKFLPTLLPQASQTESVHGSLDQEYITKCRKASAASFNEMDANCNTCKNFVRLGTDKVLGKPSSGFVFGGCTSTKKQLDKIPYKREGFEVMVAVGDWLGMPCWEGRV